MTAAQQTDAARDLDTESMQAALSCGGKFLPADISMSAHAALAASAMTPAERYLLADQVIWAAAHTSMLVSPSVELGQFRLGLDQMNQITSFRLGRLKGRAGQGAFVLRATTRLWQEPESDVAANTLLRPINDLTRLPCHATTATVKSTCLETLIDPVAFNALEFVDPEICQKLLQSLPARKARVPISQQSDGAALWIETHSTRRTTRLVLSGAIADGIYFQNGWLMFKLARLPKIVASCIVPGTRIERLIDLTVRRQGLDLQPFRNLVIEQTMSGTTWAGPWISARFASAQ